MGWYIPLRIKYDQGLRKEYGNFGEDGVANYISEKRVKVDVTTEKDTSPPIEYCQRRFKLTKLL
jgi:hypothetical protein